MMTKLLAMLLVAMATMIAELRAMQIGAVIVGWFEEKRIADAAKLLITEASAEGADHRTRRVLEAVVVHVASIQKPHASARRRTARGPPKIAGESVRGRDDND